MEGAQVTDHVDKGGFVIESHVPQKSGAILVALSQNEELPSYNDSKNTRR
jgi:hypothetical protein